MRHPIPNPPWIDRVLRQHWSAIERQVGKRMMPLPAPEPVEPAPAPMSMRLALLPPGPPTSRYDQLGMGHYGAVFKTGKPGVVLKVTSDPDEARFVVAALSLGDFPGGIVRYYDIIRLPETFRRRPVYAIWRQEAESTGEMLPEREMERLPSSTYQVFRGMTPEQSYLLNAIWEFEGFLMAWLRVGRVIRDTARRTKDKARFWAKVREARELDYRDLALDFVEGMKKAQRGAVPLSAGILDRNRGIARLAIALDAATITAEMMEHTYGPHNVGEALGFYLERDILLADLHKGNVGEVEGEIVITDPGHAVFLTDRYEELLADIEDPKVLRRKMKPIKQKPNPAAKRALFRRLMRI